MKRCKKTFVIGCSAVIAAMLLAGGGFAGYKYFLDPMRANHNEEQIERMNEDRNEDRNEDSKGKETLAAEETTETTETQTEALLVATQESIDHNICYVINCNEFITLRADPSTSGREICKIPLGAEVSYLENASNGFYKIIYNEKTGYALASYLSPDNHAAQGAPDGANQYGTGPAVRYEMETMELGNSRYMCVVRGFDANENIIWSYNSNQQVFTELDAVECITYGDYLYLSDCPAIKKIYIPSGQVMWSCDNFDGAGITLSVDDAANMVYAAGFYGPNIVAINNSTGEQVWRHDAFDFDMDIFWPYQIDILNNDIKVYYDGENGHTVTLNKYTGEVLDVHHNL